MIDERAAFEMMLEIVNEWHRQVGIDNVIKTELTRAIADTVATGVVSKHIANARKEERERCASVVDAQGFGTDFMVARKKKLSAAIRALEDEA